MNILGISAFYHDSAATITQNGEIIAAAQEERFTRIKHDPAFPTKAVEYCLMESGLTLDKLDAFSDSVESRILGEIWNSALEEPMIKRSALILEEYKSFQEAK